MKKVLCNNEELNSVYELGSDEDKDGLILHSRSGKNNPEYNEALECILNKLKEQGFSYINIFIVSNNLINSFAQNEREILIDNKPIFLNVSDLKKLRQTIGSIQSKIKVDPATKGGNPTKRILLHHPNISFELWDNIINKKQDEIFQDIKYINDAFDKEVNNLLGRDLKQKPNGCKEPKIQTATIKVYNRDPHVKAWILKNANGICELCKADSPFMTIKNEPYLEVHHIVPLSSGGEDTIENTIAVCPNCHKSLHYAKDKLKLLENLNLSR